MSVGAEIGLIHLKMSLYSCQTMLFHISMVKQTDIEIDRYIDR